MTEQTVNAERAWEFETAGEPLKVSVRMFSMPSTESPVGEIQHRLYVSISGLKNPCLESARRSVYIGPEAHNPALVAARDLIEKTTEEKLGESLGTRGMSTSYRMPSCGLPNTEFHPNSVDEVVLLLDFNYSVSPMRQPGHTNADANQLAGLNQDITDAIESIKTQVQQLVAENAARQPNPADPNQTMAHQLRYEGARRGALDHLQRGLRGLGPQYNDPPGRG